MNEEGSSFSHFRKTVTLIDWWLIKADNDFQGKRLAVAGSVYGKGKAGRLFHSAPITQSYDAFTLETSDGIFVILHGFVNRTHTVENGFPSEALSLFEFGFPPEWEDYAENCFEEVVNSAAPDSDTSKGQKEDIVYNAEYGTSKNLSPSADCLIKDASLTRDNIAEGGGPSYDAVSSDKQKDELQSTKKCKKRSDRKLKIKVSASLESITLENVESKDCSVSSGDYMDNLSVSDFDHTARTGARIGTLIAPKKPKSKKEEDRNDGNNYRTRSRTKEKHKDMPLEEGGSSMKKSSRKFSFDSHASPHIGKSKERTCILSPESLCPKRSRAGRLLLPTLHFWRNQIPLYDENRSIIGIQEEIKLDRGSKSEPQKKQKKR